MDGAQINTETEAKEDILLWSTESMMLGSLLRKGTAGVEGKMGRSVVKKQGTGLKDIHAGRTQTRTRARATPGGIEGRSTEKREGDIRQ